jgi:hypothetical protein
MENHDRANALIITVESKRRDPWPGENPGKPVAIPEMFKEHQNPSQFRFSFECVHPARGTPFNSTLKTGYGVVKEVSE